MSDNACRPDKYGPINTDRTCGIDSVDDYIADAHGDQLAGIRMRAKHAKTVFGGSL